MTKVILPGEEYIFLAITFNDSGKPEEKSLSDAFYRVAAKHGIKLNSWTCGKIPTFRPSNNVSFKDMQEIIDEVSQKSETSVFISLAEDFDGKRMACSQDPIASVQEERILCAVHPKHRR